MAAKRHKAEEIVTKLRQVDVLSAQGKSMAEAIRSIGVTEVKYCRWRSEYGGLKRDQIRQHQRGTTGKLIYRVGERRTNQHVFTRSEEQSMPSVTIEMLGDRQRRIRRLQAIARAMDTAFAIPGTNVRFGADALLGLIPGAGDIVAAAIGLAIVNEARRLGVPNTAIAKMLINIGLDIVIGAVPLLGDVFDVYFKSNRRNAQIVLDHLVNKHG